MRGVVCCLLLLGLAGAGALRGRGAETAKQSSSELRDYFQRQEAKIEAEKFEEFQDAHEVEFATGNLPCHSDPGFKLACQSVMRVKAERAMGRKVKDAKTHSLFDEPWREDDSKHFDTTKSSTWEAMPTQTFDLHYADGTHLRGFSSSDQVTLGEYTAKAPFALITDCNSPDFNGVDGILGFGIPRPNSNMPTPLLWAMTDKDNSDSNAAELARKFSFFSTDDAAEVQLGGYDPASIKETMMYVPALSKDDFLVGATSLLFGDSKQSSVELLDFKVQSSYGLPAIMDSGTSCLVIPNDKANGQLKKNPWDEFAKHWKSTKSFWLTVGQKQFEIPASSWFLADTQQTCVQPSPKGMQGLLVGDVFFREFVVEFDMTEDRPVIGIAALNKAYSLVSKSQLKEYETESAPMSKLSLDKGKQKMFPADHSDDTVEVDRIPVINSMGTQYFMDVGIGTPAQKFRVIFDTGSTVFGVFTHKDKLPNEVKNQLPSYYFSQNLRVLEQTKVSVRPAPWFELDSMSPGVGGLAALATVLLAATVVLGKRVYNKSVRVGTPSSYGTV